MVEGSEFDRLTVCTYTLFMQISFDPAKDKTNIRKHGVSLARGATFDMTTAFIDSDASQDYGETRYLAIGWLQAHLYAMCFTLRDDLVRIIILRKATPEEEKVYADQ
jgi:uncharacterized DUF497 family protein